MKLRDKDSKSNENIKSNFGKYLGEICIKYYCMFIDLCRELGIYSYELDPNSSANLVYFYKKEKNTIYTRNIRISSFQRKKFYIGY